MIAKEIAQKIIKCFKNGHFLYICGNGGSAAMSQHFAAELMCKFEKWRKPLPAIALTTDTSFLTAFINDQGLFENIFRRQIEALGKKGDILIGLSTSGKSANVINAFAEAKLKKMVVIDFPRQGTSTSEIQEYQLHLVHEVCKYIEKEFE